MKTKHGIIVDGQGDFTALRARYKGRHEILKTDGPRGHTVRPTRIISSAKKQITILKALGCQQIIILTDFECRQSKYTDFLKALTEGADSLECGAEVLAASPNRMFENWYLADIAHLSKTIAFLRDRISQKNYEGTDGKKEFKKHMKKGVSYSEVRHGGQLFVGIRIRVARKNSASFDHFLRCIET